MSSLFYGCNFFLFLLDAFLEVSPGFSHPERYTYSHPHSSISVSVHMSIILSPAFSPFSESVSMLRCFIHPSICLPPILSIHHSFPVSGCLLQASVSGGLQDVRFANMDCDSGETNRSSQHKAALILPPLPPTGTAWLQKAGWQALGQTDRQADASAEILTDGMFAVFKQRALLSNWLFSFVNWQKLDLLNDFTFAARNFKQHLD